MTDGFTSYGASSAEGISLSWRYDDYSHILLYEDVACLLPVRQVWSGQPLIAVSATGERCQA